MVGTLLYLHWLTVRGVLVACRLHEGYLESLLTTAKALAPEAQYPVQLRQAVSSLKYLIDTAQLNYSDVRPHSITLSIHGSDSYLKDHDSR